MTTGNEHTTPEGGAPRPFDFRAPDNGGDGQLDVFARMHDVFASTVAAAWSRQLRCEVALAQTTVARVTFADYVQSLPTPSVLHELSLPPLDGRAVLELDSELALAMLDRTLGGRGEASEIRRLTALEEDLLTDVTDQIRLGLSATFDPIVDVAPELGPMLADPEFLATAEPTDPVVLVAFLVTLKLPDRVGEAVTTVAYPAAMLAPVLERLSAHEDRGARRSKGPIDEVLPEVSVDVAVRFRPTQLPAAELAALQVGDVLALEHRAEDPALGSVGDAVVFEAHVGRRGKRLAVRIARVRTPEERAAGTDAPHDASDPGLDPGATPTPDLTTQPPPGGTA